MTSFQNARRQKGRGEWNSSINCHLTVMNLGKGLAGHKNRETGAKPEQEIWTKKSWNGDVSK